MGERDLPHSGADQASQPQESALDRLVRDVEAEADADPTGEASRELDELRGNTILEAERVRGKAMEEAWGFPPGTGEAARQIMAYWDDEADAEDADADD